MRLKPAYQKQIRDYGISKFCQDYNLGIRWMDYIFKGERHGKKPSFGYEYLRKIGRALNVATDDLLE